MFCQHCGSKIDEGALFCSGCGNKVPVKDNKQTGNAPEVQTSPFTSAPAPEVQTSPFTSAPAPEVQPSPFTRAPVPEVNSSPFTNVSQMQDTSNPFSDENEEQIDTSVTNKKDKNKTKKSTEKKNDTDNQSSKIFLMALVQIVFIVIIAYMGLTGKFNNSLGEINIAYTVFALLLVMGIDVVLYALLFKTKQKKIVVPQPPIEPHKTDMNKPPEYMRIESENIPSDTQFSDDDATEVTFTDDEDATEVIFEEPVLKFPRLEYMENDVKKEILINKNEFIIGRLHGRVDFITTNKKIGRIHAAIITRDGSYFVKDFNSQNKTYINRGGAIAPEQEYAIKDNDVISFADSEFVFKLPE